MLKSTPSPPPHPPNHVPLHLKTTKIQTMKIKLTPEQIQRIADDPVAAADAKIKVTDPWWVIVLKVLRYVVELILAGAGGYMAVSMCLSLGIIVPTAI